MRAGIICDLVTLEAEGETVMDFKIGVVKVTEGRLRAAGSMSGISGQEATAGGGDDGGGWLAYGLCNLAMARRNGE